MRIDPVSPSFYTQITQAASAERYNAPTAVQGVNGPSRPGVVVDISPETWAAYKQGEQEGSAVQKAGAAGEVKECQTCKNRRYADVSNDPSVSFQTPTHISPNQSASMVMAHEKEHVANEQAKADREGRKVVSQTVTLQMSTCPECGRMYVAGGVTRTITADDNKTQTADPTQET
jgi:hypothetical protein